MRILNGKTLFINKIIRMKMMLRRMCIPGIGQIKLFAINELHFVVKLD